MGEQKDARSVARLVCILPGDRVSTGADRCFPEMHFCSAGPFKTLGVNIEVLQWVP